MTFKIRQERAKNLSDLMNIEKHYELNFSQFAKNIKKLMILQLLFIQVAALGNQKV